jgi:phosphoglycolate phosphatase-like HAD superfamily hydrolase
MLNPAIIIFDCDGVLLDANHMKINAFRQTLADYPAEAAALFSDFQARNFGRSRYVLFELFFQFLGREPEAGEVDKLVECYARRVRSAYLDVPLTPGCQATLERLAHYAPLYVASGSDQEELRWVMAHRSLGQYFAGVLGSPASKADILAALKPDAGSRALFIGDAKADLEAAQCHDWCDFVYMRLFSTAKPEMELLISAANLPTINTLPELMALLLPK